MSHRRHNRQATRCAPSKCMRLRHLFISILFLCVPYLVAPANADVLSQVGGIVTDPLKLGRASDNILQAVNQINAMLRELEGRANQDLKDRIAQVQTLVDGVITAVDRNVKDIKDVIANAELQITQLEKKIVSDAEELLNKVQCTVKAIVDQDVEGGISKVIDQLRDANPALTLFGIPILKLTVKQVRAQDPFRAYLASRDALLVEYNKLRPSDPAYNIPLTFANISNYAYLTRCEDIANAKPAIDEILLRDEIKYKAFQQPWIYILSPTT